MATMAIGDVAAVLRKAIDAKVFDGPELTAAPVAAFYDMDLLDAHMADCNAQFGATFHHHIAIKSNSISTMLVHAHKTHGMGIECASIGEVLHAMDHCGVPASAIVFDSPCKTERELHWALEQRIHCNLDNFDEFARAKAFFDANPAVAASPGPVGFRINPLVGAGEIAELSVSTAASKFGVPITEKDRLLEAYKANRWMSSVHVHVGSGGMGVCMLAAGIRVAVDVAVSINELVGGAQQVTVIDIGGGLPANYGSDEWAAGNKIPTFAQYAAHLKAELPELFSGAFRVVTEFGQAMNAKSGFLASRIEWMKGSEEHPIAIIHFGGSECVRQVYGGPAHARRVEAYRADGSRFEGPNVGKLYRVGGPLCFQGDFVAKGIELPPVGQGDYIVMKDAGANTLSIFSRHCSRLCPAVWGYRWDPQRVGLAAMFELKPREAPSDVSRFWGAAAPVAGL